MAGLVSVREPGNRPRVWARLLGGRQEYGDRRGWHFVTELVCARVAGGWSPDRHYSGCQRAEGSTSEAPGLPAP